MKKNRHVAILSLLLSTMLVTGCAQEKTPVDMIPVCTLETNDMFSDRDMEVDYDEDDAISIILEEGTASCESDIVRISGSTVTITDEGTYILTGTLDNGSIIIDAEDADKVQLVLDSVDITCESSAAIYVKQADKVFVTLAPNADNHLKVTGEFVAIDDNNIDAVIFSKADLTLNGSGSLHLESAYGHGIVSKDDLVFTGGNYDINVSNHGLSGKDSIRIAAGTFHITAGEDGIHSENDDDMTLGFVYMSDGNVTIAVGDDAIHAGNQILIEGGTVNITRSEEGIEGLTVDIAGGDVTVNASDDGLNATDGSSSDTTTSDNPLDVTANVYIKISGGVLKVIADGDGIDSNGNFYVTGGEIYVSGPENSGNGSIDYDGVGQITGGIIVAAGTSGMAQNFGNNSTQCAMMVNLESMQEAGTVISLKGPDGKELINFRPEVKYNCITISCPEIQIGDTYTLLAGEESMEIEMKDTIYGGGMMGGPGGMGGQRPGGNGGMGGRPEMPEGEWNGEMPQMPESGFNGEMPQMPEGGFDGEMPQMPEGEWNGEMPQMPESGFNGERPQRPEGGIPQM